LIDWSIDCFIDLLAAVMTLSVGQKILLLASF